MDIEVHGTEEILEYIEEIENKINSNDLKEYLAKKMLDIINQESENKIENNLTYTDHNKYEILDDGILIYNDVQNDDGEYYSLIIEYGSGIYAEGQPFHHTDSYENSGGLYWLVPVANGSSLERTTFPIIDIKLQDGSIGSFYKVYGQEAKHIYTDAAIKIEKELSNWIRDYIEKL